MKKQQYKKNGQLILGLNGWSESGHDASVALVEVNKDNCVILGALEEEKISKQKCSFDAFPSLSIKAILEMHELIPDDIDYIAYGWNYPKIYDSNKLKFPFPNRTELLQKIFGGYTLKKEIPIEFIDHHLAHAASSFRTSNFDESLILVIDGQGELESTSVWIGRNNQITKITDYGVNTSFGYIYEAVNSMLGFRNHESGKTMGLAPYGKPIYLQDLSACFQFNQGSLELSNKLQDLNKISNRFETKQIISEQKKIVRMWEYYFREILKIKKIDHKVGSFYDFDHALKDLSSSVQKLLENQIAKVLEYYVNKTGIHHICLSGGVALNCILNGELLSKDYVKDLFINPAANDAGVSLGAALELSYMLGYASNPTNGKFFSPFLGIEYTNDEIIKLLENNNIYYQLNDDASDVISELIYKDKTVALFQGRNEWGPRALGNRSIVTLPKTATKLDYINKNIKKRESGRPLGPSLLKEDAELLLSSPKVLAQYMNIAYKCDHRDELAPAVIHVDKTFRPEFVDRSFNDMYYQQLARVKEKNGNSIVINTSFNLDTPIIYHLNDAIYYFLNSKLDGLVFNNEIVITK